MKKAVFASLLSLGASLGASLSAAHAEEAARFEGFKVGLQTGLQRNKIELTAPGGVDFDVAQKGHAVSGFVGYDKQIGDRFVLGAQVGVGRGGPDISAVDGTARITVDTGLTFDASARAGVVLGERMLVFGRAGYASTKLNIDAVNSAGSLSPLTIDKRRGGLLYGGGAEFALTDNLNLRLEYRRSKLDEVRSQQVLAGVAMSF